MYEDHRFTNLVLSLTVKIIWKSAFISWSYGQDVAPFFDSRSIYLFIYLDHSASIVTSVVEGS